MTDIAVFCPYDPGNQANVKGLAQVRTAAPAGSRVDSGCMDFVVEMPLKKRPQPRGQD